MPKKPTTQGAGRSDAQLTPMVAATLAGVIYQARLLNRQAKLNIPEQEIVSDVIRLWHTMMDALGQAAL